MSWCYFTTYRNFLFYLAIGHLQEYPDYAAYSTPVFFLDDWLNLYLDKHHMHVDPESYQERNEVNCSDYRFVYMGAKGLSDLFLFLRIVNYLSVSKLCHMSYCHELGKR